MCNRPLAHEISDSATHALLLAGGKVADITAAATFVSAAAPSAELVGDKGHDANHRRHFVAQRSTLAVISSTSTHELAIPHAPRPSRLRNVIEHTFYRIKDFHGIATRYETTARNSLAAIRLVCTITYPI